MSVLGLLATWIPAQRALLIDPLILLRERKTVRKLLDPQDYVLFSFSLLNPWRHNATEAEKEPIPDQPFPVQK